MPGLTRKGENPRRRRLEPRGQYLPVSFQAHVDPYREFHELCGPLSFGEGFARMVAVIRELEREGALEARLDKLKGTPA